MSDYAGASRLQTDGTTENVSRPMPAIAIIGTEGSGKTVLTTTLAKRLSTIDSRGVFLNPQGVGTLKYVEKVWQTLQQGDWPPSTPPGQLFELRWKLEIIGEMESEVRLVDAAGQDLRLLFGEDRVADTKSLPEFLRRLAEYCRCADIVLFLINLKDFTGQGNPQQRTENEAAIKGAMDYLSADGRTRRFCIVFTQVDLYRQLAATRGGWRSLAAEAIPYIYAAYIESKHVPIFLVSAVNKTKVAVDDSGVPRRVPEPGFGSDGFDKVVDWMTAQVREVQASSANRHAAGMLPSPVPVSPPTRTDLVGWFKKYFWIGIVALVLFWLWAGNCSTTPPTKVPKPSKPQLSGVFCRLDEGAGFISDEVYLTNRSGKTLHEVRVQIKCTGSRGETKGLARYWAAWSEGEEKTVSFSVSNKETVKDVQRIDMDGECDEGLFGMYWTPKAAKH